MYHRVDNNKEILGPEDSYLSTIGALSYLAKCPRPDISPDMNLLVRYSSALTRHLCKLHKRQFSVTLNV